MPLREQRRDPQPMTQPEAGIASAAGLRYVSDAEPGFTRRRRNGRFAYFYPGRRKRVQRGSVIRRIDSLAIPPAYEEVWICADPAGHIQATARDAKGRKQYRYHPKWEHIRGSVKFDRMREFGAALPRMRRRVAGYLGLPGMPKEKLLAALVKMLEVTLIRIGNDEYARRNRSYGLTTLRKQHVRMAGTHVHFSFRGKSGKEHQIALRDGLLSGVVRACMALPGRTLFQYVDEAGRRRALTSNDVNAFLRELAGEQFTAKDFRTWAGSTFALARLSGLPFETERQADRNIRETVKAVAERLGNTAAISRKSYIHPSLFEAYKAGRLPAVDARSRSTREAERRFMRFLRAEGTPSRQAFERRK
jgi:DNA topoisomerase-1